MPTQYSKNKYTQLTRWYNNNFRIEQGEQRFTALLKELDFFPSSSAAPTLHPQLEEKYGKSLITALGWVYPLEIQEGHAIQS